jgi:hypothetical protein
MMEGVFICLVLAAVLRAIVLWSSGMPAAEKPPARRDSERGAS